MHREEALGISFVNVSKLLSRRLTSKGVKWFGNSKLHQRLNYSHLLFGLAVLGLCLTC